MNKFLNLFTTALFVSLAIFASCGGGDTPPPEKTPQEAQAELLTSGAVTTTGATLDGTAVEGWDGLTLTFNGDATGGTATLSNSPDVTVFPSSTTWTFTDATTTTSITRGDGVVMTISVSASAITCTFDITTTSARVAGIDGRWVISSTR